MMGQKGCVIFALDHRDSAGRGHAFESPLHFRLGALELSDQRDGVQHLKSLPYVDSNRIGIWGWSYGRSEEHTSELQSHLNLVCRLLLEKKKKKKTAHGRAETKDLLSAPSPPGRAETFPA